MRAAEVLIAHHDVLRSLISAVEADDRSDEPRRRALVDEFAAEVLMHAQIEDEIYYPAVRNLSALVTVAHSEHRQLADQLAVVLRRDVTSDRFAAEWELLAHTLEHHAAEEETQMFPEVAAKCSAEQLEALGDRLQARLDQLHSSRLTQLRLATTRGMLRHL